MLQFKQDDTAAELILTLTEYVTIPAPFYLFVFTHVETKVFISFVKSEEDDESDYPQRYNKFTINAASLFENRPTGEWHYKVYQIEDGSHIDFNNLGPLLEEGKMILDRETEFQYKQYDTATTYKSYNG